MISYRSELDTGVQRCDGTTLKEEVIIEFIKSGGIPILFVLLFWLLTLGAAASFVWRPDSRKIDAIQSLSKATLYAVLGVIVSCLAAVGAKIPTNPDWAHSPDIHLIIMQGISESMSPGILGFTALSLVWLLSAVEQHRVSHAEHRPHEFYSSQVPASSKYPLPSRNDVVIRIFTFLALVSAEAPCIQPIIPTSTGH
jgi:hypothetical protein